MYEESIRKPNESCWKLRGGEMGKRAIEEGNPIKVHV
jgi:hypothetical protein